MIMRCSLSTNNINETGPYMTSMEMYLDLFLISHFSYFNILKSVLYVEMLAVGKQIILTRSVIIQIKCLVNII